MTTETEARALIERLRSSAKAFRENTVYDSVGDPLRLIVQADECDEAAAMLETLLTEVEVDPKILSDFYSTKVDTSPDYDECEIPRQWRKADGYDTVRGQGHASYRADGTMTDEQPYGKGHTDGSRSGGQKPAVTQADEWARARWPHPYDYPERDAAREAYAAASIAALEAAAVWFEGMYYGNSDNLLSDKLRALARGDQS
jgi:hypothetical protein